MTFSNLAMLFALSAVAIPVMIHLLHRRRFDVVEWGAMQFLQIGQSTRRRFALEEILLLILRMGLVAMIVLALAGPLGSASLFSLIGGRPPRNFVVIFDGSYSMGFNDGVNQTPHQTAKEWARNFVKELGPGDGLAILRSQEQVIPLIGRPTQDLKLIEEKTSQLPEPHGGSDLPRAVLEAQRLATAGGTTEIIILSDARRHGLSDSKTMTQWEKLAHTFSSQDRPPILRLLDFFPADHSAPNYSLAPLKPGRSLVWTGQEVTFKTAIGVTGASELPALRRIRLEIDGQPVRDLPLPKGGMIKGQMPLSFSQRFSQAGAHLVSVILEPDLPAESRPANYRLRDSLPGDNRQDFSLEVVDTILVLLVDGASSLSPESSTFFLTKALGQSPDPKRAAIFETQVVTGRDFDPSALAGNKRPRVLILADIANLTLDQQQATTRFVNEGGGVLVTLGERAGSNVAFYSQQLHQDGKGWLPARLENVAGDLDNLEQASSPDLRSFQHPALEMFRAEQANAFAQARFPLWWKVTPDKDASVPAMLTSADPWLVEKTSGRGRVLLCTVPLDRSWGANLPTLWEYPVLVHELTAYLAAVRTAEFNLQPGQPILFQPEATAKAKLPSSLQLFPPTGDPIPLTNDRRPFLYPTSESGTYRIGTSDQTLAYYVAHHDIAESDLTPTPPEERQKLTDLIGLRFQGKEDQVSWAHDESGVGQELWWLFLLAVILLLCAEVWLTRRMAQAG